MVPDLLLNLHNILNINSKKSGINNINNEDDDNNNFGENIINFTNEKSVISSAIKKFVENFKTKISDLFFYLRKTIHECPFCKNILGYSSDICSTCSLYPDSASIYLEKSDLNIIDLFKHYQKKKNLFKFK